MSPSLNARAHSSRRFSPSGDNAATLRKHLIESRSASSINSQNAIQVAGDEAGAGGDVTNVNGDSSGTAGAEIVAGGTEIVAGRAEIVVDGGSGTTSAEIVAGGAEIVAGDEN